MIYLLVGEVAVHQCYLHLVWSILFRDNHNIHRGLYYNLSLHIQGMSTFLSPSTKREIYIHIIRLLLIAPVHLKIVPYLFVVLYRSLSRLEADRN